MYENIVQKDMNKFLVHTYSIGNLPKSIVRPTYTLYIILKKVWQVCFTTSEKYA